MNPPRILSRLAHQIQVANQIDGSQLSQVAVLLRSEKISRTTDGEVLLGNHKSVRLF